MTVKNAPKARRARRIFLVEDHPVTREGFAQLIDFQPDLRVCGQAGEAAEALSAIETLKPELVIVDLSLGSSNGLELIKDLQARQPALPVLVLSTHDESLYAERAVRAGARGYVMKQSPTRAVMSAIRKVLAGELWLSEAMRARLVRKHLRGAEGETGSDVGALSDRELEVFELIGNGHTTRQIAGKLSLSISTVETYRAKIKEKLWLSNAVELVRRAADWVDRRSG